MTKRSSKEVFVDMDDVQVLEIEDRTLNLKTSIENIVKSNIEVVVLSMLSEKSMSGYDIIKEIFSKYDVFLSQGTVYPLLYSLKKDGILQAEFRKGDMRSKIYRPTVEGAEIIENKIEGFIKTNERVLSLIKREVTYMPANSTPTKKETAYV